MTELRQAPEKSIRLATSEVLTTVRWDVIDPKEQFQMGDKVESFPEARKKFDAFKEFIKGKGLSNRSGVVREFHI